MMNVAYALMVRDMASGVERHRIDDALAGKITIDTTEPIDHVEPTAALLNRDNPGPILPNARNMEELRAQWGATPDAIRSKLQFDQTVRSLPSQRPKPPPKPNPNPR